MKLFISMLLCSLSASTASAQIAADLKPEDRESISALLQQTLRATDEQRLLNTLIGKWKLTSAADAEPRQIGMAGEAEFEHIAMGNFVQEQANFGGSQFAIIWRGVYGFDPLRKQFTATWFTNLNTIAVQGVAEASPDQSAFNFRLSHPLAAKIEEATNLKTSFVYRIQIIDPQHLKFELIELMEGADAVKETVRWHALATKTAE